MDVLRPPVVWINGRCYRKLPFEKNSNFESPEPYQEQEDTMYEDEVCDGLLKETSRGFMTELKDVPNVLYKFIIGRGGEMKKRIEGDTDTRISIPGLGQMGHIVITGPNKAGVLSARSRVIVIAESSRQKIGYTHFVSLPLYFDGLAEKAAEFKESVMEQLGQGRGIHPSIFQIPSKLHLTVGMLKLLNEDEVGKAAEFLSSCYKDVIRDSLGDKAISVQLHGVEYMNDDPANVNVLYARVIEADGTQRLQNLAESLVDKFVNHGMMVREFDRVKLHATLMNTSYHSEVEKLRAAQGRGPRVSRSIKQKLAFDATELVKVYEDFDFGTYQLKEIHISEMGSYDSQGHYKCEVSVPLP